MRKRKNVADTRMLVGYWHDRSGRGYPHPQALVDLAWEPERRQQIVQYLKSGHVYAMGGGYSYCRFGCTQEYWHLTDDPSAGEYLQFKDSSVIIKPESQPKVSDHPGYYVKKPGPLANGYQLCGDAVWCWPQGLAHYVEVHGVRLPDEFVAHAAGRRFQITPAVLPSIREDDQFWRGWCETHAPFIYEPHCKACTSPLP